MLPGLVGLIPGRTGASSRRTWVSARGPGPAPTSIDNIVSIVLVIIRLFVLRTRERAIAGVETRIRSHHDAPGGVNTLSRYAQWATSAPGGGALAVGAATTCVCCVGQLDGRDLGTFEARLMHA